MPDPADKPDKPLVIVKVTRQEKHTITTDPHVLAVPTLWTPFTFGRKERIQMVASFHHGLTLLWSAAEIRIAYME